MMAESSTFLIKKGSRTSTSDASPSMQELRTSLPELRSHIRELHERLAACHEEILRLNIQVNEGFKSAMANCEERDTLRGEIAGQRLLFKEEREHRRALSDAFAESLGR